MKPKIMESKSGLATKLRSCRKLKRTLLSINIFDYISFRTLAKSFASAGRPVIAQCSSRLFLQYSPSEVVAWRDSVGAANVWLHLDHCGDLALFKSCVKAGFDAVMFDGSHLPLAENIRVSRKAVLAAKRLAPDVLVECEIGHVRGVEDGHGSDEADSRTLRIDDVLRFYNEVRPDMLAVGFGNMHGHYKGDEVFDLRLMESVHAALGRVLLVLHGGSGMDISLVGQLVGWGHCKLNISTDLKHFWLETLRGAAVGGPGLDSPLAVTQHLHNTLGGFFDRLQEKYKTCLL